MHLQLAIMKRALVLPLIAISLLSLHVPSADAGLFRARKGFNQIKKNIRDKTNDVQIGDHLKHTLRNHAKTRISIWGANALGAVLAVDGLTLGATSLREAATGAAILALGGLSGWASRHIFVRDAAFQTNHHDGLEAFGPGVRVDGPRGNNYAKHFLSRDPGGDIGAAVRWYRPLLLRSTSNP